MKVLIPVDGTQASEASLHYLTLLTAFGDVEVRLLGIASPELRDEPDGEGTVEHLRSYLLRQELTLKGAGFAVDTVVQIGLPALDIVNEAQSAGVDLILMSTHARSDMERWRLGSVTDAVARLALRDLLIVPAVTEGPPHLRNLLVALDGSAVAENALPEAARWAVAMGARLHLVQVATTGTVARESADMLRTKQSDRGSAYLAKLREERALAQSVTSVMHGLPEDCLIEYSRTNDIDVDQTNTTFGRYSTAHPRHRMGRAGRRSSHASSPTDRAFIHRVNRLPDNSA